MIAARILAVHPSPVVRAALRQLLRIDEALCLVDTIVDDDRLLGAIARKSPDIVLLDLGSSVDAGIETMGVIRRNHAKLPVILMSEASVEAGRQALFAFERSASDFVHKPRCDERAEVTAWGKELRRKILSLVDSPLTPASLRPASARSPEIEVSSRDGPAPAIVGIGSSTGGPQALLELLQALSPGMTLPILIVHHMPKHFLGPLAERLSAQSGRKVQLARDGAEITARSIWLAEGDQHMIVQRKGATRQLKLNADPPVHSCRPAVDPLFFSLASLYGATALAVVLTGMGKDGFEGARAIFDAGGAILVQNRETSVVWGMPGFIAKSKLASACGSPHQLGKEISARALLSRRNASRGEVENA